MLQIIDKKLYEYSVKYHSYNGVRYTVKSCKIIADSMDNAIDKAIRIYGSKPTLIELIG